jgi:two-component system chemotaxis response regulator CheY
MSRAHSVLIVDDDGDCRASLGEVLEGEGCTVYTAENGVRALELLKSVRPDLLVIDLMMPVMNGWDLCVELDRDPRLADIPVVVLSGVARFCPRGRKRIVKPLRLNTLVALLDVVDAPTSGLTVP